MGLAPAITGFAKVAESKPPVDAMAEQVYRQFSPAVVKIQVVGLASGAKAVIGTGFFVGDGRHLITNYHVISKWLHKPDEYRVEYLDADKQAQPLQVLKVDMINDLAVVQGELTQDVVLPFSEDTQAQGIKLYSMGFPHDLGSTIVEGTYNGFLEHAFYGKIHFTGSLNPGMSGGPAVNARGEVVGINVSTAGEQVSFLVPVAYARKLYMDVADENYETPESFLPMMREQLYEHQGSYLAGDFLQNAEKVDLGGFKLPTQPADFFNCWADGENDEETPYRILRHYCSTEDYLFISDQHYSGTVSLQHTYIEGRDLNRYQFASLYESEFDSYMGGAWAGEEHITPFRCHSDNVQSGELTFKTVFCVRAYRKLEGLYDALLKVAVVGEPQRGLISQLSLFGVSYETATRLSKSYMEAIEWQP